MREAKRVFSKHWLNGSEWNDPCKISSIPLETQCLALVFLNLRKCMEVYLTWFDIRGLGLPDIASVWSGILGDVGKSKRFKKTWKLGHTVDILGHPNWWRGVGRSFGIFRTLWRFNMIWNMAQLFRWLMMIWRFGYWTWWFIIATLNSQMVVR